VNLLPEYAPTKPQSVAALVVEDSVMVTWDFPDRNADKVLKYEVYHYLQPELGTNASSYQNAVGTDWQEVAWKNKSFIFLKNNTDCNNFYNTFVHYIVHIYFKKIWLFCICFNLTVE